MDKSAKPDKGYFLGVVSVVAGIFIPVLQANGVDLNWQTSLAVYFGLIVLTIWSLVRYAIPHLKVVGRVIASAIVILLLGALGVYATRRQYVREHPVVVVKSSQNPSDKGSGEVVTLSKDEFDKLLAGAAKPFPQAPTASAQPMSKDDLDSDLKFEFYGKDKLYFRYSNPTRHVASKPAFSFGLMDLSNPYIYSISTGAPLSSQPFPIPAKVLSDDYVRPTETQGNEEILKSFSTHLRQGDIILGAAWLTCINCSKRRVYYLYWKVGEGGWYAEIDSKKVEIPAPSMTPYSENQINEYVDKMVAINKRLKIPERPNE